ncbi:hypothetical protein Tco_0637465 [Tanacetum coccineum]
MKIPIIRKGEYDIWSMRMRQYICHTDHNLWDVIVNGDLEEEPAPTTGETSAPPTPKTAKQLAARRNQERVKSILLLAIPDEYLLKFHNVADAKSLWEAIKSRFDGNEESKKMQKNVLKHQFENFVTASNETLDKAYDRFQKLISQLEIHGAYVSKEDINQKFLRSLPPSWSQIALIMRNKPDIDEIDIDDLYNNLRVYEDEMKKSSTSSSNTQNLAFFLLRILQFTIEVSTMPVEILGKPVLNLRIRILQMIELNLVELDLRWQGSFVSKSKINRDEVIIKDWTSDDEDDECAIKTVSFVKPNVTQAVRSQADKSGQTSQKQGIGFKKVHKIKACFVCKSTDHLIKDCDFYKSPEPRVKNVVNTGERVVKPVWDLAKVNIDRSNVSTARSISTVRPVNTVRPVYTVRPVSTARPLASKIAQSNSVIRPNHPRLDIGNLEILLQDHAVVDSGCSSHMTGNKAYLSDYEDLNGALWFGKVIQRRCDKKNSVLFTEFECLIMSPSFKLLYESQVVLRAPRKDDVYNLDLKNIVPSGGITCLYANAIADESKLWNMRLGHVFFLATKDETTEILCNLCSILKKLDFCSIKTATTPIELNKPLVKDEDGAEVDVHEYRSMIGSLMYLTASRPDIMFAVCACARFQVTPKASYLHVVKRIFRYLKHQPKLGLWYPRDSPFKLEAFSDSDYAGASLDRKSTTGGCQFLGRRLISWQCKKQTIMANSTTKAEYVAAHLLIASSTSVMRHWFCYEKEIDRCSQDSHWTQKLQGPSHKDCDRYQVLNYSGLSMDLRMDRCSAGKFYSYMVSLSNSLASNPGLDFTFLRFLFINKSIWPTLSTQTSIIWSLLERNNERVGFTEVVDFPYRYIFRYALTHNPTIYDSLVKQLWQTATVRTLANGTQQLVASIDSKEYTITEASVRRAAVDQGEGSAQPAKPHHTPVDPISFTSQPPIPSPPHPSPPPHSPLQSPPHSPPHSPH